MAVVHTASVRLRALASGLIGARVVFALLIALVLSYWHTRVNEAFSPAAVGSFCVLTLGSIGAGAWFVRALRMDLPAKPALPLELVCGYFLLSTTLFVVSLLSPFGAVVNFAAVIGAIGAIAFASVGRHVREIGFSHEAASYLCVAISAAGATLWASDALDISFQAGDTTVFTLWSDSFFHAAQIGQFSQAHGAASLSNIRMAGAEPSFYHYAAYAVPAALVAITGTPAYHMFAGFLLPFGILLSGAAAFSLANSMWGRWAGIAATAGLILLPDAYQQGFGNRYLSYNFMQQVNVGGLYGVAYAAIAWILVLDACRRGRVASLAAGWGVAVLTLLHKAHIFVANAFVIMIFPFLFMRQATGRTRLALGLLFVALFCGVVWFSQRFSMVPTLRLDGTGAAPYMFSLLRHYDESAFETFFSVTFQHEAIARPIRALVYAAMLVVSTFGVWAIAFGVTIFLIRNKTERLLLVFPLLVLINYLVMSLGLAIDRRGIGSWDELLSRPLVWAYFVVITWTSGAAYTLIFGDEAPKTTLKRIAAAAAIALALVVPFTFGKDLQTFPAWGSHATYAQRSGVPTCLVSAAHHIRANSRPDEVVQDSEGDPKFALTGLAERREFAVASFMSSRRRADLTERLARLDDFRRMTDERDIARFARDHELSWYVLHPSTVVAWPASLLQRPHFACGGIRVYRFDLRERVD